jgi:hypothetical protein
MERGVLFPAEALGLLWQTLSLLISNAPARLICYRRKVVGHCL